MPIREVMQMKPHSFDIEPLAAWKWGDLLIILCILVCSLYGLPFLDHDPVRAEQLPGKTARVFVQGNLQLEIPLDRDQEIDLLDHRVRLAVSPEGIQVIETDCPAQICRSMGAIRFPGYQIICLPHRLLIEIARRADESGEYPVDAVTR